MKKKSKKNESGKQNTSSSVKKGSLEITRSGMGYVTVEDMSRDVLVKPQHFNTALHGDQVEVEIVKQNNTGRIEGIIKRVIERKQVDFIGLIRFQQNHIFFLPETERPMPDLYIQPNRLNGAKNGDKVVARLTEWDAKKRIPEG